LFFYLFAPCVLNSKKMSSSSSSSSNNNNNNESGKNNTDKQATAAAAAAADNSQNMFAERMLNFVMTTLRGQYSGLYKSGLVCTTPFARLKMIHVGALVTYFNDAYKSLIRRDDEYIVNVFNSIKKIYNHSEICLLNILFAACKKCIEMTVETNLNKDSGYQMFMACVEKELVRIVGAMSMVASFRKLATHDCHGMKIELCNPEEDMFYMTTEPTITTTE